jgi:protein O-GlcNAc transferase
MTGRAASSSAQDFDAALAHFEAGRLAEAESVLRALDAAEPDQAHVVRALAAVVHAAGRAADAVPIYERYAAIRPGDVEVLSDFAAALIDAGRPDDADALLRTTLDARPNDAAARNNLGNALLARDLAEDAAAEFRRAAAALPDEPVITANLARALLRTGADGEARAALEAAIARHPDHAPLAALHALALPVIPASAEDLARARLHIERESRALTERALPLARPDAEVGMTAFLAAYHGCDDREIQENFAAFYRAACPALNYVAPHCRAGNPRPIGRPGGSKIRIGFVSRHFAGHTIGKLCRGVITGLDRDRFSVSVFAIGANTDDPIVRALAAGAEHFALLPPSVEAARAAIAEARLDILYFTDIGMEPVTYFLAFSRLAPVQCVTWGHPVTTGLATIDHFLSAVEAETADSDAHYTERLHRFPAIAIRYAAPQLPTAWKSRDDLGLKTNANVYFCPQSLFKVHPDFDGMLAEILATDPRAIIYFIEGPQASWGERLRRRFADRLGGAADRIRFLPRLSGEDFLHALHASDVVLDTPHFCGGNTTLEALAVGKAPVTLPGGFARSRVSRAFYVQAGLTEPIAADPADYVRIAVGLATDQDRRAALEDQVRERRAVLFDNEDAVRAHEDFFVSCVDAIAG